MCRNAPERSNSVNQNGSGLFDQPAAFLVRACDKWTLALRRDVDLEPLLGQLLGRPVSDGGTDSGIKHALQILAILAQADADAAPKHASGEAGACNGEILYVKALLRKDLSADIYAYWRLNPNFPDQPTANQFFGEMQFDSYRELGLQLMTGVIDGARDIEAMFARWRAPTSSPEGEGWGEEIAALAEHSTAA